MSDNNWRLRAACAGEDTETFFQEDKIETAKAICARCPVATTCLQEHLLEPHGVFGGLGRKERRRLVVERNLPKPSAPVRVDPPAHYSIEDKNTVLKLYLSGLGYNKVSEQMDIPRATIRTWIVRAGIVRTTEESLALSSAQTKQRTRDKGFYVKARLARGRSIKDVAEELGHSVSYTHKLLRDVS